MTYYYKKGEAGDIIPYLSHREFQCKCDFSYCGYQFITQRNKESYTNTRHEYGAPITITSGNRCQLYNWEKDGEGLSKHKLGEAIDITSPRLDVLEPIARKYYDVVILYEEEGFLHCHNKVDS